MNKLYSTLVIITFITLQSCSVHKPMQEKEILTIESSYAFTQVETDFKDLGEWWNSFQTAELQTLIQKALANNFDIRKSQAVIDQKKASLGAAKSSTLPDISAGLSGSRSRSVSETNGKVAAQESDSYSLSLTGTYTLDVFGENSFNLTAAELTVLATIEDHSALLSETVAEVTNTWLTIQELETRIDLLNQRIANDKENVAFVTQRHKLGLSSLSEILQARQQLISSQTGLPSLKNQLRTNQYALKLLIGEYPELDSSKNRIDFGQPLPEINPGIPSDLIKRRPDIRAALLNVKIADNELGAAVAATFPSISLTASMGTSSAEFKNLTSPDYAVWNLIGNLTLPLLDAEGRKSEVERQKAALEEQIITYKSAVLGAFKEVVDTLGSIETQEELIKLLRQQILISRQMIEQSLANYREGLEDWSDVLDAQTEYFDAQDSLISAQNELISLRISLLVSLGESWTTQRFAKTTNQLTLQKFKAN